MGTSTVRRERAGQQLAFRCPQARAAEELDGLRRRPGGDGSAARGHPGRGQRSRRNRSPKSATASEGSSRRTAAIKARYGITAAEDRLLRIVDDQLRKVFAARAVGSEASRIAQERLAVVHGSHCATRPSDISPDDEQSKAATKDASHKPDDRSGLATSGYSPECEVALRYQKRRTGLAHEIRLRGRFPNRARRLAGSKSTFLQPGVLVMSTSSSREPIRLTAEDLFSPKVEAFLDEQAMLNRALPEAKPQPFLVRLFYSSYFYLSLASGLGAFLRG